MKKVIQFALKMLRRVTSYDQKAQNFTTIKITTINVGVRLKRIRAKQKEEIAKRKGNTSEIHLGGPGGFKRSGRLVGKMSTYFRPKSDLMVPSYDQKAKTIIND